MSLSRPSGRGRAPRPAACESLERRSLLSVSAVGDADVTPMALAAQADGKLIAAGYAQGNGSIDFVVARYNADGTVDTTFGNGGRVFTDFEGRSDEPGDVLVLPDGRIVVSGRSSLPGGAVAVARYNPDGSPDTSFDGDGKVRREGMSGGAMDVAPGGTLVVAGMSQRTGDIEGDYAALRLNPDGSPDTTFGDNGLATYGNAGQPENAMDVAVGADGKVVLGGYHMIFFGHQFAMWGEIVRLNADGSPDTSFGRQTTNGDSVYDVALTPAGAVVYTEVESDGDVGVHRFDPQGNPDLAFSRGFDLPGFWTPAALEFQRNGSMLVGMFRPIQFAQQLDGAIGRLTPSGAIDTSFGGGDGLVSVPAGRAFHNLVDVVVQPSGRIVALGSGLFGARKDFSLAAVTSSGDPDPTFRFGDTANTRLGQVFVDGSDWAPAFRQFLATTDSVSSATYGQALLNVDGSRRVTHVPWVNLNRVAFQFDRATAVDRDDLGVYGMHLPAYAIADFRYDPGAATAVWTFAPSLRADRIAFELDPAKYGRTALRLDVVPGDVDLSGAVLAADASAVKRSFFRTTTDPGNGADAYSVLRDVNGSGMILADDFAAVKSRFFTHLPDEDAVTTAPEAPLVRAARKRNLTMELLS